MGARVAASGDVVRQQEMGRLLAGAIDESLAWAAWRLGGTLQMDAGTLAWTRFLVFYTVAGVLLFLGAKGILPRTDRYHLEDS